MIRYKAFQQIKTFEDALRIANIHVKGDTTIILVKNDRREYANAHERFHFVDGIIVDSKNVFIEKLYGKN